MLALTGPGRHAAGMADLAAALAIAEALERLRRFEPIIAQAPDGAIFVYYLDDDGIFHQDRLYPIGYH